MAETAATTTNEATDLWTKFELNRSAIVYVHSLIPENALRLACDDVRRYILK